MHDQTIEADPLRRVRLDVSYDGTGFAGWARQRDQRTVQGVLEDALATVLHGREVRLTVAGRTDAGVHATGQVAHADVPTSCPETAVLTRKLNGVLPADVRVVAVTVVPDAFDARFGALWRRYEYRIADVAPDPRRRGFVLAWPRSVDVEAMAAAGSALRGLHDFAAFCKQREGATTVRTLLDLDVTRDGPEIVVTVRADAFCHSMVRSLVGALLAVGEGQRAADWPASLLTLGRRASDVRVAAPHGLTLVEVAYPPDDELAERSERTRARR